MHVVVFTRSSSVSRALASTPICCSIMPYTKMTKPSADTWAIDPWVRVVPSFICAYLFQSVYVRVGDDVFLVATWNIFVIFARYSMPLLGAVSCRPSVSPEPSAAGMPLLILWLSPTRYCCRERHNSLFALEFTSSRMVSLAIIIKYKTSAVKSRISSNLIFESCVGYFDLVWSKTRMRCGLLYYF